MAKRKFKKNNNLVSALHAFSDKTIEQTEQGVENTTKLMYNQSTSRVAVDSGDTKKSIKRTGVERKGSEFKGVVFMTSMVGVWLEYGTGIHADPEGSGSRADKIPWTYYKDGQFYTTYGMVAQPFWYPSLDITRQYFKNYFNNK